MKDPNVPTAKADARDVRRFVKSVLTELKPLITKTLTD